MKKKKILIFCPKIDSGGLEKTLAVYSNFLAKYFEVIILTNCQYKNKLLLSKKIKLFNKKNSFFFNSRLINNIYCIFLYLKYFKDVNLIFSIQDHFFILFLKIFIKNLKLIIRTSSTIINFKNKYEQRNLKKIKFIKLFSLYLYNLADLVITFSFDNKKFLSNKINSRVEVIYNYFPLKKLKIKNKKLKNVFFIGRLVEDKDPIFFIENILKVSKIIKCKIHVVGKGYLARKVIEYQRKNKKDIIFHGYVKKPFEKFRNKIDLFCVTSKYDGTPNVLGEAMSYGIPCLAPNKVGLSKLLLNNEKYGYLYDPENSETFSSKVLKIDKEYSLALKKARLGFNSMKRFNKKNTLLKLKNAIEKI